MCQWCKWKGVHDAPAKVVVSGVQLCRQCDKVWPRASMVRELEGLVLLGRAAVECDTVGAVAADKFMSKKTVNRWRRWRGRKTNLGAERWWFEAISYVLGGTVSWEEWREWWTKPCVRNLRGRQRELEVREGMCAFHAGEECLAVRRPEWGEWMANVTREWEREQVTRREREKNAMVAEQTRRREQAEHA